MPPIMASPPAPVTVRAMRAPCRPSGRCFQNPISKNELSDVSSQKINNNRMLSDVTIPTIAP